MTKPPKPPFQSQRAVSADDAWFTAAGILATNWAMLEWFIDAYLLILLSHPTIKTSGEIASIKISFEQRMDLWKRCYARLPFMNVHASKIAQLVSDLKTARHDRDTILHGLSIHDAAAGKYETVLWRFTQKAEMVRTVNATTETLHKYSDNIYRLMEEFRFHIADTLGPLTSQ